MRTMSKSCRRRSNQVSRNFATQWNSVENNYGRIYNFTNPGMDCEPDCEINQVVSVEQSQTDSASLSWWEVALWAGIGTAITLLLASNKY